VNVHKIRLAFHNFIILLRNGSGGGSDHHKRMIRACDKNMETRKELHTEIDDLNRMVKENEINSGVRQAVDVEEDEP